MPYIFCKKGFPKCQTLVEDDNVYCYYQSIQGFLDGWSSFVYFKQTSLSGF